MDQIAQTVGVDADFDVRLFCADLLCGFQQCVQTLGRLTEAAEYNLFVFVQIKLRQRCVDLLRSRLVLQPQRTGIFHVVARLTQAERARTRTAVGQVDVQTAVDFIKNGHDHILQTYFNVVKNSSKHTPSVFGISSSIER